MGEFWNGLLFGMLLTILIGPVFFALIQTSIEKGFGSGLSIAIGISLSDALYIFITYFSVSKFLHDERFTISLGIVGGIVMFAFGISSILKPVPEQFVYKKIKGKNNVLKQIAKGFVLNGINPFVLVFWLGMVSMATVKYRYDLNGVILFFAGILVTVFITDIVKSYIANKLRALITPAFMKIMNRIVGLVLFIFGARLFYYAVFDYDL